VIVQRKSGIFAMSIAAGAVGAVVFACIASSSAVAEPETSVAGATDGWYSTAQAAQGAKLFAAKCSVCHGAKLQGGAGPQLVGNQSFCASAESR
jgi:mono/diheme cytochrome c family protein